MIPLLDLADPGNRPPHAKLSPDGTRLAWFDGGAIQFSILDADGHGAITARASGGPNHPVWAFDSRHLLYVKDRDGDERYRTYLVSTERPGDDPVDLTPPDTVQAWLASVPRDVDHVLIAASSSFDGPAHLYRVNIRTRERVRVADNPGDVVAWLTGRRGDLVGRVRRSGAVETLEVRRTERWEELQRFDPEDRPHFLREANDAGSWWLLASHGRDRRALVRLDLATGTETLVYQHPTVDLDHAVLGEHTGIPLLAVAHPDYPHVEFLDPTLGPDIGKLRGPGRTGVAIVSLDDAERRLVVSVWADRRYREILVDRAKGTETVLYDSARRLPESSLVGVEPVSFRARDGVTLHAYLTKPAGTSAPAPLVLRVHGGHAARDLWGYDPFVQFLANRGYAVLEVNFRGSTGYGRAFRELAIGEYAGKMHTDLVDAVRWAIARGIADPARVGIFGGSYGGYAALVGMTFTPELFACGVALNPVTDLVMMVEREGSDYRAYWHRYLGDPARADDRRRLQARSPLSRADRARGPILIVHGTNDQRVPVAHSERMVAALRQAGVTVRYLTFPNEGHGLTFPRNVVRLRVEVEEFLGRCLGGRLSRVAEPNEDYDDLVETAWALIGAGRMETALERATTATRLIPERSEAYVAAALALSWARDDPAATKRLLLAALERAVDSDRDDLYRRLRMIDTDWVTAERERRVAVARSALERGDAPEAAREYWEAWRLDPNPHEAAVDAVALLVAIGQHARALAIVQALETSWDADVARRARDWRKRVEELQRPLLQALEHDKSGDPWAMVRLLREAAAQPSVEAMYRLGAAYADGRGVDKDDAEAVRWFRRAAETREPAALHALGVMYERGRGIPIDLAEAARFYRMAADGGRDDSMFRLAMMHEGGHGVPQSDVDAARWYRRAMNAGNLTAKASLAWMYLDGRGVRRDESKSLALLREAAEAKSPEALMTLGSLYADGRGVPRDAVQAVHWYREASAVGHAGAMHALGWVYEAGRGVALDPSEAARWYRRGADAGSAEAMRELGRLYAHGSGVARDDAEALRWYRQAADAGDARAMNDIGRMHFLGHGVEQNHREAVRWFGKAADAGNLTAKVNLSLAYREGLGLDKDPAKALALLREAADAKSALATFEIGAVHDFGRGVPSDPSEAARWYRRAADLGHPLAMNALGRLHEVGRGVARDYAEAVRWYRRGSETQSHQAMHNLGRLYAAGLGVRQDYGEAMRWYERAIAAGSVGARASLGWLHADGRGVPRDEAKAIALFRHAADAKDPRAIGSLGAMYLHGRGVTRDPVEAARLLREAAGLGHADSMYELGRLHESGTGVEKSPAEAVQWYRRAAAAGHTRSKERLRALGQTP